MRVVRAGDVGLCHRHAAGAARIRRPADRPVARVAGRSRNRGVLAGHFVRGDRVRRVGGRVALHQREAERRLLDERASWQTREIERHQNRVRDLIVWPRVRPELRRRAVVLAVQIQRRVLRRERHAVVVGHGDDDGARRCRVARGVARGRGQRVAAVGNQCRVPRDGVRGADDFAAEIRAVHRELHAGDADVVAGVRDHRDGAGQASVGHGRGQRHRRRRAVDRRERDVVRRGDVAGGVARPYAEVIDRASAQAVERRRMRGEQRGVQRRAAAVGGRRAVVDL